MGDAGFQLRQARLRSRLTCRDVQRASELIAAAKFRSDYQLPISRLSEIENHGVQPTVYRMYSLCAIYGLTFTQILSLYDVDLSALAADQEKFQPDSASALAHLLEEGSDPAPRDLPAVARAESTGLIEQRGELASILLDRFFTPGFRYGYVGRQDVMMWPIIPPGSILQIDMSIRQVEEGEWPTEYERPVYFIAHTHGYSCSWASQHARKLILEPTRTSPCAPRILSTPQEAEVIGRVTGVIKSLMSGAPPDRLSAGRG